MPPALPAYPEGAPWGAANPAANESCADCHYDYDPVLSSAAIRIDGVPDIAAAGHTYTFVLRFLDADAEVSGFQVSATAGGEDAGRFTSQADDLENEFSSIRSTAIRTASSDGEFSWRFAWRAPDAERDRDIHFYVAASSANDDQSPFGDRIHYRTVKTTVQSQSGDRP